MPARRSRVGPPTCGHTFDGKTCRRRGEHLCPTRAAHVLAFFCELLVHTKGRWARKAFTPASWQSEQIIKPLFATVVYSDELKRYVRRYRIAWIEVARKNGKALDVGTPVLSGRGWTTMGELEPGDTVHAPDGSLTDVQWVSERHVRPSYRVDFADGASVVAADDHKWLVNDRRLGAERVATTVELAETLTYGSRGDRRYSVDVPQTLRRPAAELPLDPYVLGYWLGNGTANRAEICTLDPEVVTAFEKSGYQATYHYPAGAAATRGFRGLLVDLRAAGVLGDKRVPEPYLSASAEQRLALLRGLMDSDGSVLVGRNTPRVEFTSTSPALAHGVLMLARSLGWKATVRESRAMLDGRDMGPRWRVCWTAWQGRSPFALDRKTALLSEPAGRTRSHTNAVVAVKPVGDREVVCISVAHPSHVFLAGTSLTPTHNSELLAGFALYLLVADDEESAEIYGCARDRDQARKVFDVAARMVQLSPVLTARLKVINHAKRIVDFRTASYYEVVAADAGGNLGHNPHGIVFDEVLTQRDSSLWNAMRTAMGTREQPLMVAATTAGNDPQSFGKAQHDEMARIAEDPQRAPHMFVYLRGLDQGADPWDERNWYPPNPALGDFLSLQSLRDEAMEARNDPAKENAFRQFRLNQWVSQSTRWMPMHLWDACTDDLWPRPDWRREQLAGRVAYAGFDLSSKFDLTGWCLMLPPADGNPQSPVDVLWRFWVPETGLRRLDELNDGKFTAWVKAGWLSVTDGSVIDYDQVIADCRADADTFRLMGADCDEWSMWPIINRLGEAIGLNPSDGSITAYRNTYDRMSGGMAEVLGLVKNGRLDHHGNPVARFCFDQCEVRLAPYDPNLVRPDKPERGRDRARIDAVPTAAMAANAWRRCEGEERPTSAYETSRLVVV